MALERADVERDIAAAACASTEFAGVVIAILRRTDFDNAQWFDAIEQLARHGKILDGAAIPESRWTATTDSLTRLCWTLVGIRSFEDCRMVLVMARRYGWDDLRETMRDVLRDLSQ